MSRLIWLKTRSLLEVEAQALPQQDQKDNVQSDSAEQPQEALRLHQQVVHASFQPLKTVQTGGQQIGTGGPNTDALE